VHIPDGYISLATSAGAAVVAAGGVGVALRQTGRQLGEKQIPLAGLTAAFVFAAQMLNFPVGAGTSGHLIGGALAAILLGPWLGALVVAVVVIVQALLFADGGIVALGLNIVNMALVPGAVGWVVFRALARVLPKTTGAAVGSVMVGAWASVIASSFGFVLEYALGGQGGAPVSTVMAAMTGIHALIGIGEGIISAAAVGAVLAVRPDLVTGTVDLALARSTLAPRKRTMAGFVAAGLAVTLALVLLVAPLASPDPDGLERVATDQQFSGTETDQPSGGPLAGYEVAGVESERVGTIVAGAVGVVVTFAVGLVLVVAIRRRRAV
jgi:cobalt/nickel transport system permease protein